MKGGQAMRPPTIIAINGQKHSISEWAEIVGISQSAMSQRYAKGLRGLQLTHPKMEHSRVRICLVCKQKFKPKKQLEYIQIVCGKEFCTKVIDAQRKYDKKERVRC